MKRQRRLVGFSLLICLVGAEAVFGLPRPGGVPEGSTAAAYPIIVTLRENCTGIINGANVVCSMDPAEGPGVAGCGMVPTFTLPKPVGYGDVIMLEPDGSGRISDVIRFLPSDPNNPGLALRMQFFSDNEPCIPGAKYGNSVEILEGPGACTHYTLALPNDYFFCSDVSVPTVTVWGLLALTLVLLTGIAVKFGRRHAQAVTG